MQKYKIAASKSSKRYNLILTAESESEAREKVHKEWYSILSIQIAEEAEIQGTKFIFHIISGEQTKRGIIVWEDIFKSYVKLRKDLGYQVKYLYPESDENQLDDEKKARIIHDLEQGYALKIEANPIKKEKVVVDAKEAQDIDKSFYLKKELDQTHELIEKVLQKFDPIVNQKKNYNLSPEKLEKLLIVYNNIIKIKKSTNISKLREVWELALIKIGDIELWALEQEKTTESQSLLKETNSLLKEIGSGRQFREKNKDLGLIINNFSKSVEAFLEPILHPKEFFKKKKREIDTESYSFLKTLILLEKYEEKLKNNNKEYFRNIFFILFPFGKNSEATEKILIKRKVLQQNITLLRAKKSWKIGSYTTIIKWSSKALEKLTEFLTSLSRVLFFVVLFYCFFFIIYLSLIRWWYQFNSFSFNYQGILYFLIILLFIAIANVSRGVFMFFLNFVFLFFILIFSIVNF